MGTLCGLTAPGSFNRIRNPSTQVAPWSLRSATGSWIVPSSRSPNLGWMPIPRSRPGNLLAWSTDLVAFPPPRGSPFGISGGAYRVHWVWRKKGRPGKLSRMHAGRFAPTGCLSGRARGQIGSSGAARFTRCDRNQAPSCAMISVITSHDSYFQAFSGEKP